MKLIALSIEYGALVMDKRRSPLIEYRALLLEYRALLTGKVGLFWNILTWSSTSSPKSLSPINTPALKQTANHERNSVLQVCCSCKVLQCVAVCQLTNVAVCSPKSVCRINTNALGQHGSLDHDTRSTNQKNQNKTNSMTQLNITEICMPFEHLDTCALKQHTDHDTQPTNKYIWTKCQSSRTQRHI